jgi:twinkle protein
VGEDSVKVATQAAELGLITDCFYRASPQRCLTEDSCIKWEYGITLNGKQVANYRTPAGRLIAQKVREPGKKFYVLGSLSEAGLYGQHLWARGGRKIIVTEGEIDAISVSQQQEHKWPVVSVPTGAKGAKKALQAQLEWLESFEEVVLMLDNDEPGQEAARECSELFTPGKCKVATLPLKDANELLKAGRGEEIIRAMWNAKVLRPDGILTGDEVWEKMVEVPNNDHSPYPWNCFNSMLLGARPGEIVLLTAGSGIGKSSVARQIIHHWIKTKQEKCGLIFLEEGAGETGWHLAGIEVKKRLLIDRTPEDEEKSKVVWKETFAPHVFLYNHWGSTDADNLFSKIRYMVKALGCTTIVLDHISIVVSGIAEGDERRIIDNLMTKLASMVQELKCKLLLISHLRKADGTPYEEGAQISMDALRGSGSLKQLSFDIIAFERDQQDEDHPNRVLVRSLKCRRTGRTGVCGYIEYDNDTGLYKEVIPMFDEPAKKHNKKDEAF